MGDTSRGSECLLDLGETEDKNGDTGHFQSDLPSSTTNYQGVNIYSSENIEVGTKIYFVLNNSEGNDFSSLVSNLQNVTDFSLHSKTEPNIEIPQPKKRPSDIALSEEIQGPKEEQNKSDFSISEPSSVAPFRNKCDINNDQITVNEKIVNAIHGFNSQKTELNAGGYNHIGSLKTLITSKTPIILIISFFIFSLVGIFLYIIFPHDIDMILSESTSHFVTNSTPEYQNGYSATPSTSYNQQQSGDGSFDGSPLNISLQTTVAMSSNESQSGTNSCENVQCNKTLIDGSTSKPTSIAGSMSTMKESTTSTFTHLSYSQPSKSRSISSSQLPSLGPSTANNLPFSITNPLLTQPSTTATIVTDSELIPCQAYNADHYSLYNGRPITITVAKVSDGVCVVHSDQWGSSFCSKCVSFLTAGPVQDVTYHFLKDICNSFDSCSALMKIYHNYFQESNRETFLFNFVIGADSRIYEGLGWDSLVMGSSTLHLGITFWDDEELPSEKQLYNLMLLVNVGRWCGRIQSQFNYDNDCRVRPWNCMALIPLGLQRVIRYLSKDLYFLDSDTDFVKDSIKLGHSFTACEKYEFQYFITLCNGVTC